MTFEIFTGTPTALKDRLDVLAATVTINNVVKLAASTYLIMKT